MSQSKDSIGGRHARDSRSGSSAVQRGSIEVSDFTARERPRVFEARSLVSIGCALVSLLFHAGLLTTAVWGGLSRPQPPQRPAERISTASASVSEEGALEWVRLDDLISTEARSSPDTSVAAPKLQPVRVTPDISALKASFDAEAERDTQEAKATAEGLSNKAFGQYVGQINARIDRAWLRPRSPIGDDRFVCQVRIEQDAAGKVTEIALERCNGSPRWQVSLVHAIESASPLPAPNDPEVFAHAIHMTFEAPPVESAVTPEQYEPANNHNP